MKKKSSYALIWDIEDRRKKIIMLQNFSLGMLLNPKNHINCFSAGIINCMSVMFC